VYCATGDGARFWTSTLTLMALLGLTIGARMAAVPVSWYAPFNLGVATISKHTLLFLGLMHTSDGELLNGGGDWSTDDGAVFAYILQVYMLVVFACTPLRVQSTCCFTSPSPPAIVTSCSALPYCARCNAPNHLRLETCSVSTPTACCALCDSHVVRQVAAPPFRVCRSARGSATTPCSS
jgi:hypothetical protein